jgi:hypothetical protein
MNTSSAIEPVSSDSQSSVAVARQSRGNGGSRVFYASNSISDGPSTQNVRTTSFITEPNLYPHSISDNIATLKYVKIAIDGVDFNNIEALHDSGSLVNLIRKPIIPEDQMKVVGRIVIRGAFGAPVQTDVVLLSIKPVVSGTNEVNIAPPLEVLFAVCEELSECIT